MKKMRKSGLGLRKCIGIIITVVGLFLLLYSFITINSYIRGELEISETFTMGFIPLFCMTIAGGCLIGKGVTLTENSKFLIFIELFILSLSFMITNTLITGGISWESVLNGHVSFEFYFLCLSMLFFFFFCMVVSGYLIDDAIQPIPSILPIGLFLLLFSSVTGIKFVSGEFVGNEVSIIQIIHFIIYLGIAGYFIGCGLGIDKSLKSISKTAGVLFILVFAGIFMMELSAWVFIGIISIFYSFYMYGSKSLEGDKGIVKKGLTLRSSKEIIEGSQLPPNVPVYGVLVAFVVSSYFTFTGVGGTGEQSIKLFAIYLILTFVLALIVVFVFYLIFALMGIAYYGIIILLIISAALIILSMVFTGHEIIAFGWPVIASGAIGVLFILFLILLFLGLIIFLPLFLPAGAVAVAVYPVNDAMALFDGIFIFLLTLFGLMYILKILNRRYEPEDPSNQESWGRFLYISFVMGLYTSFFIGGFVYTTSSIENVVKDIFNLKILEYIGSFSSNLLTLNLFDLLLPIITSSILFGLLFSSIICRILFRKR